MDTEIMLTTKPMIAVTKRKRIYRMDEGDSPNSH
jgi:hypothetical protein